MATFEEEIQRLLDNLCSKLGFCIYREDVQELFRCERLNATKFAEYVLRAEGMNPEYEKAWMKELQREFVAHFGSHAIERLSRDR